MSSGLRDLQAHRPFGVPLSPGVTPAHLVWGSGMSGRAEAHSVICAGVVVQSRSGLQSWEGGCGGDDSWAPPVSSSWGCCPPQGW